MSKLKEGNKLLQIRMPREDYDKLANIARKEGTYATRLALIQIKKFLEEIERQERRELREKGIEKED